MSFLLGFGLIGVSPISVNIQFESSMRPIELCIINAILFATNEG